MPDLTPSLSLLRRLGLNIPDSSAVSPEQQALADEQTRKKQKKDSTWKQYGRSAVDATANIAKGFLGIDPDPNESTAGYNANALTQLGGATEGVLKSGLPLLSLTKGKPIFHGSPSVFEKFNPKLNDESDTLGWMIHGTTDPEYADGYAMGHYKHGSGGAKENILAMKPQAKNTLDLIDPNIDDISHALAAQNPVDRQSYVRIFKEARRDPEKAKELLKYSHYPDKNVIPKDEVPVRVLSELLRLNPEEFNKTQFDAIRYKDMNNESYAIKPGSPIMSAYGAPLTHDEGKLKVFKEDNLRSYEGSAERTLPKTHQQEVEDSIQQLYSKLGKVPASDYKNTKSSVDLAHDDLLKANPHWKLNEQTGFQFGNPKGNYKPIVKTTEKVAPGLVNKAKNAGIDVSEFDSYSKISDAYFKKTGKSILASI